MFRRFRGDQAAASKTGPAYASQGSFSNTGIINGDVYPLAITPVRNDYLEQVRRIAPLELKGRDAELAELREFCMRPEAAVPYMWWKGDAWTGKSALMSWFVMHPPPGVQVVSFFITGRYASQDDRVAFAENVLEQLAVRAGGQALPGLSESTIDTRVMGMLAEAARTCQARGEHLVLVVDGLDEDRGVTGDRVHSIAALLPRRPAGGMRVIVSGRPSPPLPADVPSDHPLRDPSVGRPLTTSLYASVARQEMEAALRRLMRGSTVEQDLLGLLAAANGGLSAADLTVLTGVGRWELAEVLDAVTGRSFASRPSLWSPGKRPDVYLLAHDELRRSASEFLGLRLAGYREKIHWWAGSYAERGWPEDTPEYLLRGYAHMLAQQPNEPRLMVLAADGARHDRILAASGGDGDALAEIRAALAATAQDPDPDPAVVACIAYQRDRVEDRNTAIPPELPVAWARLGYFGRADALGHSISRGRAWALMEIAAAHAENGAPQEASRLREEAFEAAGDFRGSPPSRRRDSLLGMLAEGVARAGDRQLAEEMISAVHPSKRAAVTARVAAGLARDDDGAEAMARSIGDAYERDEALAEIAVALASSGAAQAAIRIADDVLQSQTQQGSLRRTDAAFTALRAVARAGETARAEMLARTFRPREARAAALAELSSTLIASEYRGDAVRLAADAETCLHGDSREPLPGADENRWEEAWDWYRSRALTALAQVRAATGEADRAYSLIQGIEDPDEKVIALAEAAEALGAAGQADSAMEMLSAAEVLARRNSGPAMQASVLVELAWASLHAKQPVMAAEILGDIEAETSNPAIATYPLQRVALALAAAGQADRSLALVNGIDEPPARQKCLTEVAAHWQRQASTRRAVNSLSKSLTRT